MKQDGLSSACDAALATLTGSYLAFAYVGFDHPVIDIPVCPLLLLTGLRCPLCSSTHFIGELLHGVADPNRVTVVWLLWFVLVVALWTMSTFRISKAVLRHRDCGRAISKAVQAGTGLLSP